METRGSGPKIASAMATIISERRRMAQLGQREIATGASCAVVLGDPMAECVPRVAVGKMLRSGETTRASGSGERLPLRL